MPIVFYNGSTYDYHFIIEQLATEFKGKLECIGENAEIYITFSVPFSKELDNGKAISPREKNCFHLTGCQKKNSLGRLQKKKFFFIFLS